MNNNYEKALNKIIKDRKNYKNICYIPYYSNQIPGPTGPTGPQGTSITILGYYNTLDELLENIEIWFKKLF